MLISVFKCLIMNFEPQDESSRIRAFEPEKALFGFLVQIGAFEILNHSSALTL